MTARPQITLQQHPLSAAFPSMPEADVAALAEDIAKHGQREKGVLLDGMVLDGWHRYRACYIAGVDFEANEFEGEDPIAFVLSKNLHRRHLTATQRATAIVTATNWRANGQKSSSAPGAELTAKEMAKAAEVSTRTIEQAKAAVTADPELGEAMKDGKVSAKEAAHVANLPKAKREKAVKAIKEGRPPKSPKEKKEDPRDTEIKKLHGQVEALNEEKENLADTARELEDKLTAFEKTDPDEQQKEIMRLQKRIVRLEGEIERLTRARNDCQAKNNELIREVKKLRKRG